MYGFPYYTGRIYQFIRKERVGGVRGLCLENSQAIWTVYLKSIFRFPLKTMIKDEMAKKDHLWAEMNQFITD